MNDKLCDFNCRQEKRLEMIEQDIKDIKKYTEEKISSIQDQSADLRYKMADFTSRTEQQIKNIEEAVKSITAKIDKNMETQKANTMMFLSTLVFVVLNLVLSYVVK